MAEYPDLNYCPQCGEPLQDREAYGRTRKYCPACDRVIFRDPKVAAGVVVEDNGQVLLVKRGTGPGQGLWSIPAGFVEFDEDPALTAARECLEETGLKVQLLGLLDVLPGSGMSGEASFLIVYRACVLEGHLKANDDADQVAFFDVGNLPQLAFESTEQALEIWRRRRHNHPV